MLGRTGLAEVSTWERGQLFCRSPNCILVSKSLTHLPFPLLQTPEASFWGQTWGPLHTPTALHQYPIAEFPHSPPRTGGSDWSSRAQAVGSTHIHTSGGRVL